MPSMVRNFSPCISTVYSEVVGSAPEKAKESEMKEQRRTKGVFTPVDRLLCSETGIKIITILLFILGAVRFYTAKFLNGPKLLIQVTCE